MFLHPKSYNTTPPHFIVCVIFTCKETRGMVPLLRHVVEVPGGLKNGVKMVMDGPGPATRGVCGSGSGEDQCPGYDPCVLGRLEKHMFCV